MMLEMNVSWFREEGTYIILTVSKLYLDLQEIECRLSCYQAFEVMTEEFYCLW